MKNLFETICREPYRLFFPIGAVFGILGVGHWLLYSLGWIPAYSGHYHAFTQTTLYMGCFATGFLATAIPKFSDTPPASPLEILVFLILIVAAVFSVGHGNFIGGEVLAAALWAALIFFIGRRLQKKPTSEPPVEFIWLPFALLNGIVGHLMVALSLAGAISRDYFFIGRPMAEQGLLLALVAGVGGFLGPRIIGAPVVIPQSLPEIALIRRRNLWLFIILASFLFLTFCFSTTNERSWVYFLRAFIVTIVLVWNQAFLFYWPSSKSFLAKIMTVSFWMIVLGLWLCAFFPKFKAAMLHFVFLGGFSLMTFGVATMVVYRYSGKEQKINKHPQILHVITWGITAVLIFRVIAGFFPKVYFSWLIIGAASWIATVVIWMLFMFKYFLKIPDEFHKR